MPPALGESGSLNEELRHGGGDEAEATVRVFNRRGERRFIFVAGGGLVYLVNGRVEIDTGLDGKLRVIVDEGRRHVHALLPWSFGVALVLAGSRWFGCCRQASSTRSPRRRRFVL